MTIVKALYYDGRSSASLNVDLRLPDARGDSIHISGEGIDRSYAFSDVKVSPRIGSSRRSLYLPDGAMCETGDNDAVDRAFSASPAGKLHATLHRWESRFRYVAVAIVLTAGLLWLIIEYGVPVLAREVAMNMPPSAEARIGEGALSGLDRFLFKPSSLTGERKEELRHLFAGIAGTESGYKLEFRNGGRMGANAIALPAGTVVLTDELVELSRRDDELIAVLAHEIGHLKQRHALRHVLENSVTGLLIVAITGDVNSILGAIPVAVVGARYSREFEREADDFALGYLKNHGIDPIAFSDILVRLQQQHPENGLPTFLSSHPATEERAKRARDMQGK